MWRIVTVAVLMLATASMAGTVFHWPDGGKGHDVVWVKGGAVQFAEAPTRVEMNGRCGVRARSPIKVLPTFSIGLLSPPGLSGLSPFVGDGAGRYSHGGYRGWGNGLEGAVAALRIYDHAMAADDVAAGWRRAIEQVPDLSRQRPPALRREKAPFRVLFSNDFTNTGITTPWHKAGEPFKPEHLRASVLETRAADVHMLQPAHGQVPWWPSKIYPLKEHHHWWAKHYGIPVEKQRIPGVHRYIMDGGDTFADFLDACRQSDQVGFISMRLNDVHHAHHADTPNCRTGYHAFGRFYAEHPEYRLGGAGSGLNWAIPAARQVMTSYICEICANYDLAGFELDFMRFPSFFKPDFPKAERVRIITSFVREVRGFLDKRGGDNFSFLRTTDQQYCTTAHLAHHRGADGVSLFNFVYSRRRGQKPDERGPWSEPPFHLLKLLGDPDWLARQPQWYFVADNWLGQAFPRRFEPGVAITYDMDMAPTEHQRQDGFLRVMAHEEDCTGANWFVAMNGTPLEHVPFVAKPLPHPYDANLRIEGHYACFALPRNLVKDGINHIALMLRQGKPMRVRYLDVVLP